MLQNPQTDAYSVGAKMVIADDFLPETIGKKKFLSMLMDLISRPALDGYNFGTY